MVPLLPALALDCSFSGLSMAVAAAGKHELFSNPTPRSSDVLAPALQQLLEKAGVNAGSLQTVVVAVGPGSFTGSRLGLAAAEALKLVNNSIEIIGISTLQALALHIAAAHPGRPFTLLLDAAGGQAYSQSFSAVGEATAPATCLPVAQALAAIPAGHRIAAQSSLMLAQALPLDALDPLMLLKAAENPAFRLPPQPVYLKPLTYKHA